MESIPVRPEFQRADGPFVTQSGRRLPVRRLTRTDVPALIEFHDFLSRRSKPLQLLGMADDARESLLALAGTDEFEGSTVLAIMAGPTALVRGLGQYRTQATGPADARFTIDESLDRDGTSREMLFRLADHARAAGVTELNVESTDASPMLEAIERSGFPYTRKPGATHCTVTITDPR